MVTICGLKTPPLRTTWLDDDAITVLGRHKMWRAARPFALRRQPECRAVTACRLASIAGRAAGAAASAESPVNSTGPLHRAGRVNSPTGQG